VGKGKNFAIFSAMLRFWPLLFVFIASCGYSRMNVEKGSFRAIKPPNIYGNNSYLTKDAVNIISYDANIGKNKTIPLPGIMNLYNSRALPDTLADIHYRLIENTLGFQYHKVLKSKSDLYFGFGGGVQNFPYGSLIFGYNGKFVEIGGATYWGLTLGKASYEGIWDWETGGPLSSSDTQYIRLEDAYILHSYGGLTAYASLHLKKFALSYAASIANPWLVDELPAPIGRSSSDPDISFWFPALLMQDVGISYTHHRIKYRLGINQITGIEFPGQYWGLSVQMAYGW